MKLILPDPSIQGKFSHAQDTFRELATMWKDYVEIEYSKNHYHPFLKYNDQLICLFDRPIYEEWQNYIDTEYILFGNPTPPGKFKYESSWIFWGRNPNKLEEARNNLLSYRERTIKTFFAGKIENPLQHQKRTQTQVDWSRYIEDFSCPVNGERKYTQEQYLEKVKQSKFGLCLPGYGNKCNREIELLGLGTVPIITKGVDVSDYFEPLIENVHYIYAEDGGDLLYKINRLTEEDWIYLSESGLEWYERNCSPKGSFDTTLKIIEKFKPQKFNLHNEYHLGDCAFVIDLLRKLTYSYPKDQYNFYCDKKYHDELYNHIIEFDNIILHDLKNKPKDSMDTWIGRLYGDRIITSMTNYYEDAFTIMNNILCKQMFRKNPIQTFDDFLFDEDYLNKHNTKQNREYDYLICNAKPMSNQCHAYNENYFVELILSLLEQNKTVAYTHPHKRLKGLGFCTLENQYSLVDLGNLSKKCKHIISVHTSTANSILNKETLKNCERIDLLHNFLKNNHSKIHYHRTTNTIMQENEKIIIIQSYYNPKDEDRRKEIEYCLEQNLNNPNIQKVVLFLDNESVEYPENSKIEALLTKDVAFPEEKGTFTFSMAFGYAMQKYKDSICCLINNDIFLDHDVFSDMTEIKNLVENNIVLSLSRHEYDLKTKTGVLDENFRRMMFAHTQDAWIFKANFCPKDSEFAPGTLGSDNAINDRLKKHGKVPINLGTKYKIYHVDTVRGKTSANFLNKDFRSKEREKYPEESGQLLTPDYGMINGMSLDQFAKQLNFNHIDTYEILCEMMTKKVKIKNR